MPVLFRATNPPACVGPSYGFASERGYRPDWRKQNQDGYAFVSCQFLGNYCSQRSIRAPKGGERKVSLGASQYWGELSYTSGGTQAMVSSHSSFRQNKRRL